MSSNPPDSNDSRVPLILGVETPLLVLSFILWVWRMDSRCRPSMKLWWDDLFISLAMVGQIRGRLQTLSKTLANVACRTTATFYHKLYSGHAMHWCRIRTTYALRPFGALGIIRPVRSHCRAPLGVGSHLHKNQRGFHVSPVITFRFLGEDLEMDHVPVHLVPCCHGHPRTRPAAHGMYTAAIFLEQGYQGRALPKRTRGARWHHRDTGCLRLLRLPVLLTSAHLRLQAQPTISRESPGISHHESRSSRLYRRLYQVYRLQTTPHKS
jgi:hypothetical protein